MVLGEVVGVTLEESSECSLIVTSLRVNAKFLNSGLGMVASNLLGITLML